jgi:hypothetical protein
MMEEEDAFTLPPLLVTDAVIQGIKSGAVSFLQGTPRGHTTLGPRCCSSSVRFPARAQLLLNQPQLLRVASVRQHISTPAPRRLWHPRWEPRCQESARRTSWPS